MEKHLVNMSRFLSLVLRHRPDEIGLALDENGWAEVSELLDKANNNGVNITLYALLEIVRNNEKKRFSFNEDFSKIRANQGHSIEVDVELKEVIPPRLLYHGTATRFMPGILTTGLDKRARLYVHLTDNYDMAVKVGGRHGKPLVLEINAKAMSDAGMKFFVSENKVWLVEHVPVEYIRQQPERPE